MATFEFYTQINTTIFNYLKFHSGMSTRLFNKVKRNAAFSVNGISCDLSFEVKQNDLIKVELEESSGDIVPENIALDIIYEDNSILAVNKPPNMVVHPTSYHHSGTLANAVAQHYLSQNINTPIRPVIRLDKDTSGIVIFAKNALIQENIILQMKSGTVQKTYIALVEGVPYPQSDRIEAPIARLPGSIITRYVSESGESAATNYRIIKEYQDYSVLEVKPETGRTHQIRVHMQYIGYPILGDTLYGNASELIGRQALHAYSYSFKHPINQREIVLTCPVPEDMKRLI